MSATPPAPSPAKRARPAAAWLAFSAKMTAQVPAIAGRGDLTVTVAPGAGRGAPACFLPASAEIEVDGGHLPVDPATADPASPADRERYPALWGATVHECAHAAHSRWRAPDGTDAAWCAAATALEESRIEARQVTRGRRPGLAAGQHRPDRDPRLHRRRQPARQRGRGRVGRRLDPGPRGRGHP